MNFASAWVGDGLSLLTAYRPKLFSDHPLTGGAWSNTSGTVGGAAGLQVNVVGASQPWLTAVQADPAYTASSVQVGAAKAVK